MTRGELRDALWQHAPSIVLGAFVAAFFALPSNRELNRAFYFAVLPLTLLTAHPDDYRTFWGNRALGAALGFILYLCVTLLWSDVDPQEPLRDALSVLAFLLLIVSAQRRAPVAEAIALWFVVLTTVHALVVLATWYSAHGLGERMLGLGRLDHPLQLAAVQAAVGALAGVWFMAERSPATRWLAAVPAICAVSIVFTTSRGPLLALVAVIIGGAVLLRTPRAVLLTATIIAAGSAVLLLDPALLGALAERGTSFRPSIWASAWDRIDDAWLIGAGLGAPATIVISGLEFRHFHNIVLMAWYYGGVIAVALLVFMTGAAVQRSLMNRAAWPWLAALVAGLLCQIPDGGPPLTHPHPAWLYFWLPFAMASLATPPVETKTAPLSAV